MNSSVNRSSQSPRQGKTASEESVRSTASQTAIVKQISPEQEELKNSSQRQLPIPAPSQPHQYRAIGLIYGHYQRSSTLLTRGNILTADGIMIDAVMLGRAISVVKNHLDLEKPHLWVVYPRIRQGYETLHLQIVGVWEPETLAKDDRQPPLPNPDEQTLIEHGYFSVRGEVIFASFEKQTVIVKIRQAAKKEGDKPKFFKLNLKGTLPPLPVSRFWDFQVQLQAHDLVIQKATDLGFISKKRPFNNRKKTFTNSRSTKPLNHSRSLTRGNREAKSQQPLERKVTPKPSKIIKKKVD